MSIFFLNILTLFYTHKITAENVNNFLKKLYLKKVEIIIQMVSEKELDDLSFFYW